MISVQDQEEVKFFLDELEENLNYLDDAIITLEEHPDDQETLEEIFRVAHTIKGSASFLDLKNLVALGHAMEEVFQEFKDGKIKVDKGVIDTVLESKDAIGKIGQLLGKGEDYTVVSTDGLIARLNSFLKPGAATKPAAAPRTTQEPAAAAAATTPDLSFTQDDLVPGAKLVRVVISPDELAPSIRAFLVSKNLNELGAVVKQKPSEEEMDADDFEMPAGRGVSFWVETDAAFPEITDAASVDLITQVDVFLPEAIEKALSEKSPVLEETRDVSKAAVPREEIETADTVRIPVSRLDVMLNLIGELVIANSSFIQIQDNLRLMPQMDRIYRDIRDRTKDLGRISSEIQDLVMKSRLVPISQVFNRFKRFVRDYSSRTNKLVQLKMVGETTEIDKKIIDEMIKPLTHLVRNSLDHGLEMPDERLRVGKPAQGTLLLKASQEGNYIYVIIEDDGRGLDFTKIVDKAVERQLITPEEAQTLTEDEIKNLIFHSGFSTKDEVDEMSGRGVGMDVVKQSVEDLNGTIVLETAQHRGSKITIKLPLTLAILNALIVKVGSERFCIPMASIVETQKVNAKNFLTVENNEMVRLRDSLIPLVKLEKIFPEALFQGEKPSGEGDEEKQFEPPKPHSKIKEQDEYPVIVVDFHDSHVAIQVDQFLSRQEVVIKSLSDHYRSIEGISGASILGDGSIILIIDVHGVIQLYRQMRGIKSYQEPSLGTGRLPDKLPHKPVMPVPPVMPPPSIPPSPAPAAPKAAPAAKAAPPKAEPVTLSSISSMTPEEFEQLEDVEITKTAQPGDAFEEEIAGLSGETRQAPETTSAPAEPSLTYEEARELEEDGIELFGETEQAPEATPAPAPAKPSLTREEARELEEDGIELFEENEEPSEIEVPEALVEEAHAEAQTPAYPEEEVEEEIIILDESEFPREAAEEETHPPQENLEETRLGASPESFEITDTLEYSDEAIFHEIEQEIYRMENIDHEPEMTASPAGTPEPAEEKSGAADHGAGLTEFEKMKQMIDSGEIDEDEFENEPLIASPDTPIALAHFNKEDYNFEKITRVLEGEDQDTLKSWLREGTLRAIDGIKSLTGDPEIYPGKTTARKYSSERIREHFEQLKSKAGPLVALLLPVLPVNGMIYLILNHENARLMAAMLYQAAQMPAPETIDFEPLMEVTNILGSAYTNTLTQLTDIPVEPGLPEIVESSEKIIESISKALASREVKALFIENQFLWKNKTVLAELIIVIPEYQE